MSHPVGHPLRDRIEVEFVEANVETAFSLIDLAEAETVMGNSAFASHVMENAEAVFRDIEERLERLEDGARMPFVPLVTELRRQMDHAKR